MIKIQEESFGTSANGDVIKFLINFHDEDSSPQLVPETKPTTGEMLDYVSQMLDIRTTPMKEIQEFLEENCRLDESEIRCIMAGILRKKRMLKREKAKFRVQDGQLVKLEPDFVPMISIPGIIDLTYDEGQKKKKRNRISAQISRDRKKLYLTELQDENKILNERTESYHKQNMELKRKIEELHSKKIDAPQKTKSSESYQTKNRFSKLLAFLGIIFLLSCFKDIIPSTSSASVLKFNKKEDAVSISFEEQNSLIGKVEHLFGDFSPQLSRIGGPLKSEVGKKIAGLKRKFNLISMPTEVYEGLVYSTDSISS